MTPLRPNLDDLDREIRDHISVVNAVLLRPLGYAHPERMVWLSKRA